MEDTDLDDSEFITMDQGAGGKQMERLIRDEILPLFDSEIGEVSLQGLDDSAVIDNMVFTTDGHTVKPIFFPGGDLGKLSISGTINDILALGGKPVAIALAAVIPEGTSINRFRKIFKSAARTAEKVEVPVVTGDTKVVEKDDLDEPILTTTAVGKRHHLMDENLELAGGRKKRWLSDDNLSDGDKIIVSGSMGDHGITILSQREGYGFQGDVKSDVAPLIDLMGEALRGGGVASAKDPTRGGLANALNEWSEKSDLGVVVREKKIPIKEWVSSASEMLGIDPLNIGNEGKMILAVHPSRAEKVVKRMRETERGKDAQIIGEVKEDIKDLVLETEVGGRRIMEPPTGDPVPRIC